MSIGGEPIIISDDHSHHNRRISHHHLSRCSSSYSDNNEGYLNEVYNTYRLYVGLPMYTPGVGVCGLFVIE